MATNKLVITNTRVRRCWISMCFQNACARATCCYKAVAPQRLGQKPGHNLAPAHLGHQRLEQHVATNMLGQNRFRHPKVPRPQRSKVPMS